MLTPKNKGSKSIGAASGQTYTYSGISAYGAMLMSPVRLQHPQWLPQWTLKL